MSFIVCADKKLSNLDLYERVLTEKGFTVRTSTSGSDLIIQMESNSVNLLILDLGLPNSSKISYCKMIKQRHGEDVQVIVIAETDDENSIVMALNDGADDYIVKPLKIEELVSKASIALAKNKARVESRKENNEPEIFAGTYEIIKKISSGSHSSVYHGIDRTKGDPIEVAIKIFDAKSYKEIESQMQSFLLREAYGMSKLDHPNIVKMFDFGKTGKSYYLVMEFVEGESLEHVVSTTGPFSEDDLTFVAYQGSLVLEYIEDHNLVHRDIKPGNILLNHEGEIKFTDFGLAKQIDDHSLTQKNDNFMGTPQYVAPEQIMPDGDIDIRSDIYSLGATLYFVGTNKTPFGGKNVVDVLMNNMNSTPPSMNEVNPEISEDFSVLVTKMMAKKKDQRYFPSELKNHLKNVLEQQE